MTYQLDTGPLNEDRELHLCKLDTTRIIKLVGVVGRAKSVWFNSNYQRLTTKYRVFRLKLRLLKNSNLS